MPRAGVAEGGPPPQQRGWWPSFGSRNPPAWGGLSLPGFGRSRTIPTRILVRLDLSEAEQLLVVGDTALLGKWDPQVAPPMQSVEGSLYVYEAQLPPGEYKFKVCDDGG